MAFSLRFVGALEIKKNTFYIWSYTEDYNITNYFILLIRLINIDKNNNNADFSTELWMKILLQILLRN